MSGTVSGPTATSAAAAPLNRSDPQPHGEELAGDMSKFCGRHPGAGTATHAIYDLIYKGCIESYRQGMGLRSSLDGTSPRDGLAAPTGGVPTRRTT